MAMFSIVIIAALLTLSLSGCDADIVSLSHGGYFAEEGRTIDSVSSHSRISRQRGARSTPPSPLSVCVDVVAFYKNLDAATRYCALQKDSQFCTAQIRRLGNQVKMAIKNGRGSRSNSAQLHRELSEAHSNGLITSQPSAQRSGHVRSRQELRNVTFHLAVFCSSHPLFCKRQLLQHHMLARRSIVDIDDTPTTSENATATSEEDNRLERSLKHIADVNGDDLISPDEDEILRRAVRKLKRLMAKV